MDVNISNATFDRMPQYLKALRDMRTEGDQTVSSVALAGRVGLNASTVKKDLSLAMAAYGKPKVGYVIDGLIRDIEAFLGYDKVKNAILVGAGKLGQALLGFSGFEEYGLNIVAGFDVDPTKTGVEIHGKKVFSVDEMSSIVSTLGVKIAIITVPMQSAQLTADMLVGMGIRAIWNFSQARVRVPQGVALKDENMAASLAILSGQLAVLLDGEENKR